MAINITMIDNAHLPPGWREEWTQVLLGAANDEVAEETAERMGWTVHQVNWYRRHARENLGMRTLPGAVWKAKELGIL